MTSGSSSEIDSFTLSIEEETSFINLIPYDYSKSEEEEDKDDLSNTSFDSSELVGDPEDKIEPINEILTVDKKLDKNDETDLCLSIYELCLFFFIY